MRFINFEFRLCNELTYIKKKIKTYTTVFLCPEKPSQEKNWFQETASLGSLANLAVMIIKGTIWIRARVFFLSYPYYSCIFFGARFLWSGVPIHPVTKKKNKTSRFFNFAMLNAKMTIQRELNNVLCVVSKYNLHRWNRKFARANIGWQRGWLVFPLVHICHCTPNSLRESCNWDCLEIGVDPVSKKTAIHSCLEGFLTSAPYLPWFLYI